MTRITTVLPAEVIARNHRIVAAFLAGQRATEIAGPLALHTATVETVLREAMQQLLADVTAARTPHGD